LRAVELDDLYIKAYMVLGEALVELGKLDQSQNGQSKIEKGIAKLRKALSLCFSQNQRTFEKEIETQIKKAQKIKWYKDSEVNQIDKAQLVSKIEGKLGRQNEVFALFEAYMSQGKGDEEVKSQKERHGHIPDFLLCRITDDFMQEPVIIQSGFTYEKKAIIQHFQINGCTDPITR
jgi:hypothetical protein